MANLKQFILVSAYLIALLLPLWHGAEAINYAWKLGEEWLKEKPQIAENGIDPDLRVVGGSGGVSSGRQVTLSEASCPTGGPNVCSETGTGTVTGYRVERCAGKGCVSFASTPTFTTNMITIPSDDGWPNERDCPMDKEKGARVCK